MSVEPKKVNFENIWHVLSDTVKEVITLGRVDRSVWNRRIGDIYALCEAYPVPFADRLYQETRDLLVNHVRDVLATQVVSHGRTVMDSATNDVSQSLLQRYYTAWNEYSTGMAQLNCLFQYLNQQHVKKQRMSEAHELMEIGELGLDIWRMEMIQPLGDELVQQILDGINADRVGSNSNPSFDEVLRGSIKSFVQVQEHQKLGNLGLYQELFETPMLESSGEFYRVEAKKMLEMWSVSHYMEIVNKKLEDESNRAQKYLHASSISKLLEECEERMISDTLDFFYSLCKEMVSQEERDNLSQNYEALKPIPNGPRKLIQIFIDHIGTDGREHGNSIGATDPLDTLKGNSRKRIRCEDTVSEMHPSTSKRQRLASAFRSPRQVVHSGVREVVSFGDISVSTLSVGSDKVQTIGDITLSDGEVGGIREVASFGDISVCTLSVGSDKVQTIGDITLSDGEVGGIREVASFGDISVSTLSVGSDKVQTIGDITLSDGEVGDIGESDFNSQHSSSERSPSRVAPLEFISSTPAMPGANITFGFAGNELTPVPKTDETNDLSDI